LIFDIFKYRYDFDRDGYITREDVRLILSHIPIVNTMANTTTAEGLFTKEGGGK
jgi:Ca2+-binding EF-hand superfamily protein